MMLQNIIPEHELNFDDIFDVWLPLWWQSLWTWCVIAIAVGIFIGSIVLVVYLCRRDKRKKQSPLDRAIDRIVCLKKRAQEEAVQRRFDDYSKELYVELSSLIKQYLDDAYGLHVSSKTDIELYQYLTTCDISTMPEIVGWTRSMHFFSERSMCIKFGCGSSELAPFLNECENVHIMLKRASQKGKQV